MPSNAVLEAKKAKVEQLTELIKNSVSGVLVDYKGITVEEDTKLRKELREANVNYFVEKNTLLLRAFKNCGIEGFEEALNGTTALALSNDDQTAPARVLGKFAEKQEMKNSISKQATLKAKSMTRQVLPLFQRFLQKMYSSLSSLVLFRDPCRNSLQPFRLLQTKIRRKAQLDCRLKNPVKAA